MIFLKKNRFIGSVKFKWSDYILILAAILCALIILPFIMISIYNFPVLDDYGFIWSIKQRGFWETNKLYYLSLTGRFFSCFLLALIAMVKEPLFLFRVVPMILILGIYLSICFVLKKIFRSRGFFPFIFLSLIFFVTYLSILPSLNESFYWLSGSITYQAPIIIFNVLMGYLIDYFVWEKRKRHSAIIIVLLIVCLTGLTEIAIFNVTAILSVLLLWNIIKKIKLDLKLLGFWALCILGNVANILAPGNQVRDKAANAPGKLMHSVGVAFDTMLDNLSNISTYLVGLAIVSVLYILLIKLIRIDKGDKVRFYVSPIIPITMLLALHFMGLFIGHYKLGHIPPFRTLNFIYYFSLVNFGWFSFCVVVSIEKFLSNVKFDREPIKSWLTGFLVAHLFVCWFSQNNKTLRIELTSGIAKNYAKEMRNRNNLVSLCSVNEKCSVPPIVSRSKVLFISDLSINPQHWINKSLAKSVRLDLTTVELINE